jgi:hypothetical protein
MSDQITKFFYPLNFKNPKGTELHPFHIVDASP